LLPQHAIVPSASAAHVWLLPALIAVAVLIPVTGTGDRRWEVVPSPSCPWSFAPQQVTVPSASAAHVWLPPALIAVAVLNPVTRTGVAVLRVVPSPN
jgi:cytochrome b561